MWAIGNGESRAQVKIDQLDGEIVGCNAIMRDYAVDRLICVDKRMMDEAVNRRVYETALIYTRPEWIQRYSVFPRVRKVPPLPYKGDIRADEPFQWGSGPYAVLIASMYEKERWINLVGFDLYSTTDTVNNIYKNTPCYDSAQKRPVDPRYWIHQIGMVFQCFPKIQYTIYQTDDWELPQAWNYPNVTVDKLSNISYTN